MPLPLATQPGYFSIPNFGGSWLGSLPATTNQETPDSFANICTPGPNGDKVTEISIIGCAASGLVPATVPGYLFLYIVGAGPEYLMYDVIAVRELPYRANAADFASSDPALGISGQFPPNLTIPAGGNLAIASSVDNQPVMAIAQSLKMGN